MTRWAAWIAAAALSLSACTNAAAPESTTTLAPSSTTTTTLPPPPGPVTGPVRHPGSADTIYFVMTDRFANGDPSNDTGGLADGPLTHGFLPENDGYYQGGDLVGLTERLDYLADLGIGALWITPPFANRPVQGLGEIVNSSAGYHGYWQIDWTRIDPHLGTSDDMRRLISEAGARGIAVYFDVVVNHTGDVITYEEGTFAYRSKSAAPYLDAAGVPFDDAEYAGTDSFPPLDPAISFPYVPTFANDAYASVKAPEWLNDPTYYHNRGNSSFVDENSLYGDFFGLDDLFTEHPRVVDGMIDIATGIVADYDVAGFRVDTVKHVNDEFWREWVPAVRQAAIDAGRDEFFVFGEVFSSDPIFNSHYTSNLGFPSVLDFVLHEALEQYVARDRPADVMVQAYDKDDWFTDADSNASMLVTFFGNHDIGRMGRIVTAGNPGARPEVILEKVQLGFDLLFLSRGVPVVYYGDEQGFVGDGGDRGARQTMFPATAERYVNQATIGSSAPVSDDNFDPSHPLYRQVAELNRLRADHPALVTGAHIVGEAQGSVLSFSRFDRDERVEYLVVANNGPLAIPATVLALSPDTEFTAIHGGEVSVTSGPDGSVTLEVPARSAVVLRATSPLPFADPPPTVRIVRPDPDAEIPTARYRIEAEVGDRRYAEVTFSMSVDGADSIVLGTDDAPPYRLYWNNGDLPTGTTVELTAVVSDGSGRYGADSLTVTLGSR